MTFIISLIIAVILIIILIIVFITIKIYNVLVIKDTEIQVQQGQVNTALQKREDLTGQLSTLTKRAYRFEGTTQTTSARLRNNGKNAGLVATSERYPPLNSIKSNFAFFQEQLADIERILRGERIKYNDLVGDYKKYVRRFPILIFAYLLGYPTDRYLLFSTESINKPEFWNERR